MLGVKQQKTLAILICIYNYMNTSNKEDEKDLEKYAKIMHKRNEIKKLIDKELSKYNSFYITIINKQYSKFMKLFNRALNIQERVLERLKEDTPIITLDLLSLYIIDNIQSKEAYIKEIRDYLTFILEKDENSNILNLDRVKKTISYLIKEFYEN